jgi:hypothetical protein
VQGLLHNYNIFNDRLVEHKVPLHFSNYFVDENLRSLAILFEHILYEILSREMVNLENFSRFHSFGMIAKELELIPPPIFHEVQKFYIFQLITFDIGQGFL